VVMEDEREGETDKQRCRDHGCQASGYEQGELHGGGDDYFCVRSGNFIPTLYTRQPSMKFALFTRTENSPYTKFPPYTRTSQGEVSVTSTILFLYLGDLQSVGK
jgi:hypothetical protein